MGTRVRLFSCSVWWVLLSSSSPPSSSFSSILLFSSSFPSFFLSSPFSRSYFISRSEARALWIEDDDEIQNVGIEHAFGTWLICLKVHRKEPRESRALSLCLLKKPKGGNAKRKYFLAGCQCPHTQTGTRCRVDKVHARFRLRYYTLHKPSARGAPS